MALPIKPPPVLEGKAAQEFYERWAKAKDDTSKEIVQASYRKWKPFFEKYYNPYK
jgi:putative sterol carrier protein